MNEELIQLIASLQTVTEDTQDSFGQLSAEQLNWTPHSDQWSIAQCLDHLIVINSGYFSIFNKIVNGEYRPRFRERLPLLPRLFGPLILKVVQPQSQRKFKTSAEFEPTKSDIDADIIEKFSRHQQQMINLMKQTTNLNLQGIIITSPVGSVVTYSLLDAFKIVTAHEQRHLAQAKRVMERDGFPATDRKSEASAG